MAAARRLACMCAMKFCRLVCSDQTAIPKIMQSARPIIVLIRVLNFNVGETADQIASHETERTEHQCASDDFQCHGDTPLGSRGTTLPLNFRLNFLRQSSRSTAATIRRLRALPLGGSSASGTARRSMAIAAAC